MMARNQLLKKLIATNQLMLRVTSFRFGPMMPQLANIDSKGLDKALDPMHVPGRGAPKKRLQAKVKEDKIRG